MSDFDENGVPDFVDEVGMIADSTHYVLVEQMGYNEEPYDGEGGYDIYIMSYGAGVYGYTYSEGNGISYIQIDNDYVGFNSMFNLTPIQIMQVSIAHEYSHGIQFGYRYNISGNAYFYEMSAMWFEDVLLPDANDYLDGWVDPLLENPTAEFDNIGQGYELALFGHYLSSFLDPNGVEDAKNSKIIRVIWEYFGETSSSAFLAIENVLSTEYEVSFIEAWTDFISRNLYNGRYENMDNNFYYYGDQSLIEPITTNPVLLSDSQNFVLDLDNKSVAIQSYQLGDINPLLDINHSTDEYLGRISIVSSSDNNDIFWGTDTSGIELSSNSEIHFVYGSENATESVTVILDVNIDDIFGCTDPYANNYNESATDDDGSCEYECNLGDVNCDGIINILDVVTLVNIIMDDGEYTEGGDVNGDGYLNILDVVTLINWVLYGNDLTFSYPTQAGNHWEYFNEMYFYYFTSDSVLAESLLITVNSYTTISGEVVLNDTVVTTEFLSNENDTSTVKRSYYIEDDNGLYLYAYSNAGAAPMILPRSKNTDKIIFKNVAYNNFSELINYIQNPTPIYDSREDIYFEDPPCKTLEYPLEIGNQWTFRDDYSPWRIDKKVMTQEVVELTAGIFDTYQIKWLYDMDHNGVWDEDIWIIDNISSQGLVSRSIYILGGILMDENGDPIDGYSNWINHNTLTFTNVGINY